MSGLIQVRIPQAMARSEDPARLASRRYFSHGTYLLGQKKAPEAEGYLREALRLNPDDPDVLNNLGTAVWEINKDVHLKQWCSLAHRALISSNPMTSGSRNRILGIVSGPRASPTAPSQQVLHGGLLRKSLILFDAQMNLGVALRTWVSSTKHSTYLLAAKVRQPDSADAWDNVGMTLARQGHWPEAMAHYDKAIELRPDFGEARRNRALGWLAHGDFERGWEEAEWRLKCRNPPGFA